MTPVALLAAAIAGELERATPVGPDVVRFAETALGGADDRALLAVLADRDDPDHETLAELLLFPDAGMKAALEPLLAAVRLEPAQERAVAETLAGLAPAARFLLPGGAMVSLAPLAQALAGVVARLRPADGAPRTLAGAVDDALPPEAALAARVRLPLALTPLPLLLRPMPDVFRAWGGRASAPRNWRTRSWPSPAVSSADGHGLKRSPPVMLARGLFRVQSQGRKGLGHRGPR
jgi:hypothetical protein